MDENVELLYVPDLSAVKKPDADVAFAIFWATIE